MGNLKDELLNWMTEVAEARLENVTAGQRTVELKFTNLTLRMWVDRVRNILPKEGGGIMAGEHILKLLIEENARIAIGDRWMYCNFPVWDGLGLGMEYTVFERKPHRRNTKEILVTDDEELACRVLKSK